MPMVNVWVPKGALSAEQQASLSDKLTHALLLIEGRMNKEIHNPAALSIAWVLFHEVEPTGWAIGGKLDDTYAPEGGRFLTVVTVPGGALDHEGAKPAVVETVHTAFREILGLPAKKKGTYWAPWVIIQEVPEGNWGAGGVIRHLKEIGAYAMAGVPAL
jgi:phenylpyruvate tautomerase PptA (4-oxalocrotonate tautomerase family)